MPDQAPVAATRLGEAAHAVQVRDQRLHRLERGRIEIELAALLVRTLTHHAHTSPAITLTLRNTPRKTQLLKTNDFPLLLMLNVEGQIQAKVAGPA